MGGEQRRIPLPRLLEGLCGQCPDPRGPKELSRLWKVHRAHRGNEGQWARLDRMGVSNLGHYQRRSDRPCDSQRALATIPTMLQRLLPFLLVLSAVGTLTDGWVSPRPLRAVLAAHRTVLADPDGWALVRGPLGDRPQARIAAASRSSRDARRPTPDDSAILADALRVPRLPTSARLAASRVHSGPAPFRLGPVSRAPPGLSAPPF